MHITKRPSQYPMLAIQYEDSQDPFFEANVMTSLKMLDGSDTMKKILAKIKDAKPGHKPSNWPNYCHVLITPPIDRAYTSGVNAGGFQGAGGKKVYEDWRAGKVGGAGGLKLKMAAKCQAQADNRNASEIDANGKAGAGSVCYMFFANREVMTKSGEPLPMHTTLAHELIHCMHYLYGDAGRDSRSEEYRTVGLKDFLREALSENNVRSDIGMEKRKKYFGDD